MIHRCLIFILVLTFVFSTEIQSRNNLINEDRIWLYEGSAYGSKSFEFKMKFDGDTIVDGKTYNVLKTFDCVERDYYGLGVSNDIRHENGGLRFLLREEDGRVYVHSPIEDATDYYWDIEDKEALLYDFNVTEGEEIKFINNAGYLSNGVVSKLSVVNICDEDYKSYLICLDDPNEDSTIEFNVIEGIGNITCGCVPLFILDSYTGNSLYSFPPVFVKHNLVKVTNVSGNVICEKLQGLWSWENSSIDDVDRDDFIRYDGKTIFLNNENLSLYDISGKMVAGGSGIIPVDGLLSGTYIVMSGHKTLKIVVR